MAVVLLCGVGLGLVARSLPRHPGENGVPVETTPDGRIAVPPAVPPSTTPTAADVTEKLRGRFAWSDAQRLCVAGRLDADPQLRDTLAKDGERSSQAGELASITGACVSATAMAEQLAVNIATQAGGPAPEGIACLRDGYSTWTPEELDAIAKALATPGTTVAEVGTRLDGLLDRCDVDLPADRRRGAGGE